MNFDNMNEEQYNKFIDDISTKIVAMMIEKQAEYDAQFKLELEKQYGYQVEFTTSNDEFLTPEQELELLQVALEQALEEERYEDVGAIENEINQIKNKKNDKN